MLTIAETKEYKIIAELSEEVQNLHARLYPEIFKPYNKAEMEKQLESQLAQPNYFGYVAQQAGINVGSAVYHIKEVQENAFHYTLKTLHIEQLAVLNKFQKNGAGKILLRQAEKIAQEHSIKKIELDHWHGNVVAASYFKKNGYALCKERLFKMIN